MGAGAEENRPVRWQYRGDCRARHVLRCANGRKCETVLHHPQGAGCGPDTSAGARANQRVLVACRHATREADRLAQSATRRRIADRVVSIHPSRKRHMPKTVLPLVLMALAIVPAAAQRASTPQKQPGAPSSVSGIDPAAMDRSADACTDFYRFACGGWMTKHPLPADQSIYGRFNELQERNNEILRQILETAASSRADGDTAKIGAYYAGCMDESGIAAKGLAPLKEDFERIFAL